MEITGLRVALNFLCREDPWQGVGVAEIKDFLKNSFSLEGLEPELAVGLSRLARPMKLAAGTILFENGDPGNGCYVSQCSIARSYDGW